MNSIPRRGLCLVLVAPSGAGKSSISRALLAADPSLSLSVSATTRAPRPGERQGEHYDFLDDAAFDALLAAGGLLEWAKVYDDRYGTPAAPVRAALAAGRDMLFDIDWQGTQQIYQRMRSDVVSVFVLPPSAAELKARLERRAEDSEEIIARRLRNAAQEIPHWTEYDYVLINCDLHESFAQLRAILTAERLKRIMHSDDLGTRVAKLLADLRQIAP